MSLPFSNAVYHGRQILYDMGATNVSIGTWKDQISFTFRLAYPDHTEVYEHMTYRNLISMFKAWNVLGGK